MAMTTDSNYFTDGDELTTFMLDMRAADQIAVSSLEYANAIIADFRNSDMTSPWPNSLDRIDVADRLQELVRNPPVC
jgi:hypothetical protein